MRPVVAIFLMCTGLLSISNAAKAEDCQDALAQEWAGMVDAEWVEPLNAIVVYDDAPPLLPPDEDDDEEMEELVPGVDLLADRFEKLRTICADDRQALSDLISLEARRAYDANNFERVLALLNDRNPNPANPNFARNAWMWLVAKSETGGEIDDNFMDDDTIWYVHDTLLSKSPPFQKVEEFDVADFHIWGYVLEGEEPAWMFVAKDSASQALETTIVHRSEYELEDGENWVEFERYGCSIRTGINEETQVFDASVNYDSVKRQLVSFYLADAENETDWIGGNEPQQIQSFCPYAFELLPALGLIREFTGGEYRDPSAPPSEAELTRAFNSNVMADRIYATDWVMDHPDAIEPMGFIYAVTTLMAVGDMERAAFWYFFYQIRSRPWLEAASDPTGYPALAGSIDYMLGMPINQWAGSDWDAYMALWRRVMAFEREAPLYPGRPDDISEQKWAKLIAESRASYVNENILADAPLAEKMAKQRRDNGLYVGPWQEPGAPLKEDWR